MIVFETAIKDTEVIGITALNASYSRAFIKVTYSFKILTKSNSLTIYSPDFSCDNVNGIDAWLKKYKIARETVFEQIGELQPTS